MRKINIVLLTVLLAGCGLTTTSEEKAIYEEIGEESQSFAEKIMNNKDLIKSKILKKGQLISYRYWNLEKGKKNIQEVKVVETRPDGEFESKYRTILGYKLIQLNPASTKITFTPVIIDADGCLDLSLGIEENNRYELCLIEDETLEIKIGQENTK